jgi:lipoyl synthase
MSEFKGIPILTGAAAPAAEAGQAVPEADRPARSGEKYRTPQGFTAIKDGIKSGGSAGVGAPEAGSGAGPVGGGAASVGSGAPALRKPSWLKAPMALGSGFSAVKSIVREHRLSTVCEEAKCPNIGECWNAGTATIMLMGAVCTRACRFCAVDTGNPRGWLDPEEPENVARSVELMRLKYVVLTSVDRDDLPDGGAAHYAAAIRAIKARNPGTAVEALTPDFSGVSKDVRTVMDSGLDVFAQNVETVERLTHPVRDPRAGYRQTLDVLGEAKAYRPAVLTKTSLMLGLGETDEEIRKTLEDLRAVSVDLLTLGQYLRPTPNHLAVERFVTPEQFEMYRRWALDLGFLECVSGPLVRSSYRAEQALARNNAGLERGLRRPITPAKA